MYWAPTSPDLALQGVGDLPVVGEVEGEGVGAREGAGDEVAREEALLDLRDAGGDLRAVPALVEPPEVEGPLHPRAGVGAVADAAAEAQGLRRHQVDVDRHLEVLGLVLPGHHLDAAPVGAVRERVLELQDLVDVERLARLEVDVAGQQPAVEDVLVEEDRAEQVARAGVEVEDDVGPVALEIDADLVLLEGGVEIALLGREIGQRLLAAARSPDDGGPSRSDRKVALDLAEAGSSAPAPVIWRSTVAILIAGPESTS